MAISPKTLYPGQIDLTDPAGYPEGKARNINVPGDGTGTPWEKEVCNDLFGFQQALLDVASAAPSGTPDKVGASQYLDGVRAAADEQIDAEFGDRIAADEWVYPTPKTRQRTVSVFAATPAMTFVDVELPWRLVLDGASPASHRPVLDSRWHGSALVLSLNAVGLPPQSVITRIKATVKPGAARPGMGGGGPGANGRMWLGLYVISASFFSPLVGGVGVFAAVEDDGTTDIQQLDSGAISEDVIGTKVSSDTLVVLYAGNDAPSSHEPDRAYAFHIEYTDPGPRNL